MLLHCDRTPAEVVFAAELRALAVRTGLRLIERHTAVTGRLTPDALADAVPDWAARQTWACGPAGLLDTLTDHWRRAGDPDALHIERFRPPTPVATDTTGGRVRFTTSGIETDAGPGTPLMAAGEAAGAVLPSGCRMGICHTCVGRLRAGAVRNLHTGQTARHPRRTRAHLCLRCRGRRRDRAVGGSPQMTATLNEPVTVTATAPVESSAPAGRARPVERAEPEHPARPRT